MSIKNPVLMKPLSLLSENPSCLVPLDALRLHPPDPPEASRVPAVDSFFATTAYALVFMANKRVASVDAYRMITRIATAQTRLRTLM
ncbi:MAG: hypothetical protein DWI22_00450 [Planctomycetota bacterium]|nr:MAG: hypothetical protein DWI22_00450 [Planctomycetota bacterium]